MCCAGILPGLSQPCWRHSGKNLSVQEQGWAGGVPRIFPQQQNPGTSQSQGQQMSLCVFNKQNVTWELWSLHQEHLSSVLRPC